MYFAAPCRMTEWAIVRVLVIVSRCACHPAAPRYLAIRGRRRNRKVAHKARGTKREREKTIRRLRRLRRMKKVCSRARNRNRKDLAQSRRGTKKEREKTVRRLRRLPPMRIQTFVKLECGCDLSLRAQRSNLTDRRISSELAFWPWMALYICATGMARKCDACGIPLRRYAPRNDHFL